MNVLSCLLRECLYILLGHSVTVGTECGQSVPYYYSAYRLTPHQGQGQRWLVTVHPRWADHTSTGTVDAKSGEVS